MARWKPKRAVVGLAGLLAVCAVGVWAATNALGCGSEEREVFARFPGYEGRAPEPRPSAEPGLCRAWLVTPDTRGEVYTYYGRELRERGWEVEVREPPPRSTEPTTLEARQGAYAYTVAYEPDVRMPGGRRVQVIVGGWAPPRLIAWATTRTSQNPSARSSGNLPSRTYGEQGVFAVMYGTCGRVEPVGRNPGLSVIDAGPPITPPLTEGRVRLLS